jgi:hypothetical protein
MNFIQFFKPRTPTPVVSSSSLHPQSKLSAFQIEADSSEMQEVSEADHFSENGVPKEITTSAELSRLPLETTQLSNRPGFSPIINDEVILRAYIEQDFAFLSSLGRKGPLITLVTERGQVEAAPVKLHSQQVWFEAIVSRRLVVDPVNSLLTSRNLALLERVIELRLVKVKKAEIKRMLQMKLAKLALISLRNAEVSWFYTHKLLGRFDIIADAVELFEDMELIPDAVQILEMVDPVDITPAHLNYLSYIFGKLLTHSAQEPSRLVTAANPMVTCVILSNFIDSIKDHNRSYTLKLETLSSAFVKVAEAIKDEISDIQTLEAVYSTRPFNTTTFLIILVQNPAKYRSFLNNANSRLLAVKYWTGDKAYNLQFNHSSYVFKALDYSNERQIWSTHRRPLEAKCSSVFQLSSWVHSCSIRHSLETVSSIYSTIVMVYIISTYTRFALKYTNPLDLSEHQQSNLQEELDGVKMLIDYYFVPYSLLVGANTLIKALYRKLTDQQQLVDPRFLFDILICVSALGIKAATNSVNVVEYFWAVLAFSYTMRVLLCLIIDQHIGPILRMLFSTFLDITRFMLVFTVILLCFAVSFHNLFYDTEGYSTLSQSLTTMISAALGSFDFYSFTSRDTLGHILLLVWVVIANILILNILIAVLSSRYTALAPQANADYVSLLVAYHQTSNYVPTYGGMIVFPLPLTGLLIPFLPLYLLPVSKERVTSLLVWWSYLPVCLVAVTCFTLCNILMTPICYAKILVKIACDPMLSKINRIAPFVKWLVGGLPYLAFLTAASLPRYVRHLFAADMPAATDGLTPQDVSLTRSILHTQYTLDPCTPDLSLSAAMALYDQRNPENIDSETPSLAAMIALTKVVGLGDSHKFIVTSKKYRARKAYSQIIQKLTSYHSNSINLKESIEVLDSLSFEQLLTYSKCRAEKTLADLAS